MNTIQLVNSMGDTVTYTDSELTTIIGNGVKSAEKSVELSDKIRDIKYQVRDFFSECEWRDGEQTVTKSDFNELLERIGSSKLTTKYNGTFTITGSFSIEVEDEDEIEDIISENTEISNWSADMDVDQIEVHDVEEDN